MDGIIASRMPTDVATNEDLIAIFGTAGAAGVQWTNLTVPAVFLRALECKMYLLSANHTMIEMLSKAETTLKVALVPLVHAVLKRIESCVVARPTPSDVAEVLLCSADEGRSIVVLLAICIRMQSLKDNVVSIAPVCAVATKHLNSEQQQSVLDCLSKILKS